MLKRFIIISTMVLLGACGVVQPYTFDIKQGNVINDEQVAQVKVGMTASQVTFLLGSPAIRDPFSAERWDYVYHNADEKRVITKQIVSIFFLNGKVSRIKNSS